MKQSKIILFLMMIFTFTTTVFATITVQPVIQPVKVSFIDTGNSDAILIQDNGKNMLIDAGENDDEKLMVDYIKAQDIKKLDYIVLTHPDADHSGGLDAVVKNFEVGSILIGNGSADTKTYKDFVQAAMNKNLKPSVPLEDKVFTLGNGTFQFYNTKSLAKDVNDRSLVMLYKNGEHEFLFTGDASKSVEKVLLEKMIDIDVLKVGHHGSNTSTSKEFLDKIKPEIAVITCGKDNKYGHPHKDVSDLLKNVKTYRTDLNGTITITTNGKELSVSTQKVEGKVTQTPTVTKFNTMASTTTVTSNTTPTVTTNQNAKQKVWITGSGTKYHLKSCRYVNEKSKELDISTAQAQKYEACKVCH